MFSPFKVAPINIVDIGSLVIWLLFFFFFSFSFFSPPVLQLLVIDYFPCFLVTYILSQSETESSRAPLLGPSVSTNVSSQDQNSDSEQEDDQDEDDELAPIIKLSTRKRRHPFIKLLLALWPFGESFKELSVAGKIYEIVKVRHSFCCNCYCLFWSKTYEIIIWKSRKINFFSLTSPIYSPFLCYLALHCVIH